MCVENSAGSTVRRRASSMVGARPWTQPQHARSAGRSYGHWYRRELCNDDRLRQVTPRRFVGSPLAVLPVNEGLVLSVNRQVRSWPNDDLRMALPLSVINRVPNSTSFQSSGVIGAGTGFGDHSTAPSPRRRAPAPPIRSRRGARPGTACPRTRRRSGPAATTSTTRRRERPREREPRPVRERSGEEDVVEDREPARSADGIASGPGANSGARIAIGIQPSSIIQPDSVFCAIGSFHLRRSTVPSAQPIAAPRISSAAVGVRWKWRISSPSSSAIPSMPSAMPAIRRAPERLREQHEREQHAPDRHRVREDRAASGRQLLHAEQHEPVPERDVEERERAHLAPQRARNADRVARQTARRRAGRAPRTAA